MSQRREGGRFRTWSTSPFRGGAEIEESPKRQEETREVECPRKQQSALSNAAGKRSKIKGKQ